MSESRDDPCEWLHTQVGFYDSQFTVNTDISIAICTFNVNNQRLPENDEKCITGLRNWLHMYDNPKIIAIGLQEIDMNAQSVIFGSTEARNYWKCTLSSLIGADEDEKSITRSYLLIASKQLVGLFLCVFVHKSIRPDLDLREVDVASVSIGKSLGPIRTNRKSALYNFGNKGAIGIHLQFQSLSIVFVNAHLHPHIDGLQKRRQGISTIMKEMTFCITQNLKNSFLYQKYFPKVSAPRIESHDTISNECPNQQNYTLFINDHDVVFFFGDLNFRLATPPAHVLQKAIVHNDWNDVFFRYDQLVIDLHRGTNDPASGWYCWKENHARNIPSYRYLPHKNVLDLPDSVFSQNTIRGNKGRIPGFPDRILWAEPKRFGHSKVAFSYPEGNEFANDAVQASRVTQKCVCLHTDVDFSDHKPVSALFSVSLPIIDPQKRMLVENRLLSMFDDRKSSSSENYGSLFEINHEEIHFGEMNFGMKRNFLLAIHNISCDVLPLHIKSLFSSLGTNTKGYRDNDIIENRNGSTISIKHHFVKIQPSHVVIYPGDTFYVEISCEINHNTLQYQNEHDLGFRLGESVECLDLIVIIPHVSRIDDRKYISSSKKHVSVMATLKISILGNTLQHLVLPRFSNHSKDLPFFSAQLISFPLWWLINFLSQEPSVDDLHNILEQQPNEPSESELDLVNLLDQRPYHASAWEMDSAWENILWRDAYGVLRLLLRELQEPVVEFAVHETIINPGDVAIFDDVVKRLSPVHRSNFIFIISFLRYLLKRSYELSRDTAIRFRETLLDDFVDLIIPHAPRTDAFDSHDGNGKLAKRVFLEYAVTMEHDM